MLKVALTHDVDRTQKHYQYFTNLISSFLKGDINGTLYHIGSLFGKEPYWNFPEIIRIEREMGVKSTFFFLDETIPFNLFDRKNWALSVGRYRINNKKIENVIRWLDQNGWEIGVHGSYNSYKDEDLLKKEKENIENIVGHKIIGTRQHYLNLSDNTWNIHRNLGFKYDSTWGYTEGFGIREGKILPYKPFSDFFVEFPLTIMDIPFMEVKDRWEKYEQVVETVEKNDGILVFNWHQRVYKEKEFPGYRSSYVRIIEDCKKRNAKFRTLGEFYDEIVKGDS